jgi:hypothetical protein
MQPAVVCRIKTLSITPINNRCQDDFEKSGLNFKATVLTGGEQVFAQKRLPESPIRLLLLLLQKNNLNLCSAVTASDT